MISQFITKMINHSFQKMPGKEALSLSLRTGILAGLLVLLLICTPVSAVMLEETFMGKVSKLDPKNNMLNVNANSEWSEKWLPTASHIISAEAPNPAVFDYLKQGDAVEATRMGGKGGPWISIGKIRESGSTEKYLGDSFGDPSALVSPFVGNSIVSYENLGDCQKCEGTTCPAILSTVSVTQSGKTQGVHEMAPGETWTFVSAENLQYNLEVTFVEGKASSADCPGREAMTGPQPISDFIVHVVQKGATTAPTEEPATIATTQPTLVTSLPTTPATPVPTTKSPGFTALWAVFGLLAVVCLLKRN